jgi:hypothetical protein
VFLRVWLLTQPRVCIKWGELYCAPTPQRDPVPAAYVVWAVAAFAAQWGLLTYSPDCLLMQHLPLLLMQPRVCIKWSEADYAPTPRSDPIRVPDEAAPRAPL